MELMKLKHQQQNTNAYIQAMEQRIQRTQIKQQQTMQFLARAVQNPAFLQQLAQLKDQSELEEAMTKKRRPIDQGASSTAESSCGDGGRNPIKAEPLELGDYVFKVSELETLALEMQGYGAARKRQEEEEGGSPEIEDRELDEEFWDELLSGNNGGGEDINVSAERLGYLGYSPE